MEMQMKYTHASLAILISYFGGATAQGPITRNSQAEAVGKARKVNESASPLNDRNLDNLIAFAKLYGYVRYFHPSDEAAATKWESFLIDGISAVEAAQTAEELA